MLNTKTTATTLLAILFSIGLFAQKKDWTLKNEKEGVKVYYRSTGDVHEVKLATSIQTSFSSLVHLFSEVENFPKWGYKVVESRLLKRVSDTEIYYYSKLDFPWPLNDRDIIMHSVLIQDAATGIITAKSVAVPDYVPEVKDVVRMKTANTVWSLYPGEKGWRYIEYYIYSKPGGNIPDWLVNMAIDVGPRETIKSIKKILQQPAYREKRLAYIKE